MFCPSRASTPGVVWGGPSETPATRAMDCSQLPSDRCYCRTFTSRLRDKFFPQTIRLNWTRTSNTTHTPPTQIGVLTCCYVLHSISYTDWTLTHYYSAPWQSVCTNSYRTALQRYMCTVIIVFIIVFISCSLYSIIFTICCSLPVLSPLYMCVAYIYIYIYIQYLSSITSCCSLHKRLSPPVHLRSRYCDNKVIWFEVVTCLLFISCTVRCWITTANCLSYGRSSLW